VAAGKDWTIEPPIVGAAGAAAAAAASARRSIASQFPMLR